MAQQTISQATPRKTGWLTITVMMAGRPRTFAAGPWLGGILAIVLPALAAWYLGATLYLMFHDQLLASLIARQMDAQYAYEDRIAGLSTQLDRQTSRSLLDRRTLETTVTTLEDRSTQLAARAAMLDRLMARSAPAALPAALSAKTRAPLVGSRNPLVPDMTGGLPADVRAYSDPEAHATQPSPPDVPLLGLRNDTSDGASLLTPGPQPGNQTALDSSGSSIAERTASIAATLSAIEHDQSRTMTALREPTFKAIAKLRIALMELGLPANVGLMSDLGGPFVPLPAGGLTFEQDAALLQDAVLQADRLQAVADKVPLRKPLPGPLDVTSTFGPRIDPFLGRPAMHTGIDFREPYGESVHVTAGGTVTIAASEGGYGTMVEVDHGNGLSTRYAHLSSASVVTGQKIEAGAIVGRVGSSGRATGPHLHYETRINGEAVDPTRFLKVGARLFGDT